MEEARERARDGSFQIISWLMGLNRLWIMIFTSFILALNCDAGLAGYHSVTPDTAGLTSENCRA